MKEIYSVRFENSFLRKLYTPDEIAPLTFRYLEKHSLLRQMEDILRSARADPFGDLLLPALLRFFGNIAHLRPKQVHYEH